MCCVQETLGVHSRNKNNVFSIRLSIEHVDPITRDEINDCSKHVDEEVTLEICFLPSLPLLVPSFRQCWPCHVAKSTGT